MVTVKWTENELLTNLRS